MVKSTGGGGRIMSPREAHRRSQLDTLRRFRARFTPEEFQRREQIALDNLRIARRRA